MNAARETAALRRALEGVATPERAIGAKAYLKSDLTFLGASVPDIRKIARQHARAHAERTAAEWLTLAVALYETGVHELRSVAIALLADRVELLRARDMQVVEQLLRQSDTWAHVDWICTAVASPLVERFASAKGLLARWSRDENFWLRRAAMLSLLVPLREGGGDFDLFARFAERMLEEKEFFIRKAIGWILRDTSRRRPELVRDFVAPRVHRVSGLTFREATRNLPAATRIELERARERARGA